MKFSKALWTYIAADILCMFINFTISAADNPLLKAVNGICAAGIMIVFMANFAVKSQAEDSRAARMSGSPAGAAPLLSAAGGLTAVPAVSWGVLMVSVGGKPDYYRWHKVLNGAFLRIYNLIEKDASSAALSVGEVLLMLPFVFVPAAAYTVTYILAKKGVITAGK